MSRPLYEISAEQPVSMILGLLENVKRQSDGSYMTRCPSHQDRTPSLSVDEGRDGRVILNCHAGCPTENVVAELGLEMRDLFVQDDRPRGVAGSIVAAYDYTDEAGELLYQAVRFVPKDFRQRRPDGRGGWIWKVKGKVRPVVYNLPAVCEAVTAGELVIVTEGEKDADNLGGYQITATCNAGGAGKWRDHHSAHLRGARVAIIADKDQAGREHAQQVARSLAGIAAEIRILEMPGDAKDASDWIEAERRTDSDSETIRAALVALVDDAPRWKPAETDAGVTDARVLVDQVVLDVEKRYAEHERTGEPVMGLRSGIGRLDRILGGFERGLTLLAGGPGVGKTSLARQIALHVADREAVPVVYLSFENSAARMLLNILAARADVTVQDCRRGYVDPSRIRAAAEQLAPVLDRLVLLDGDGRWTVDQLHTTARQAMEAQKASRCLVIIDYLQLWAKTAREYRAATEARGKVDALAGDLLDLARRLDSPVLAIVNQNRAAGSYGNGKGSAALDSLKESGDLEYSCDVALFLTEAENGSATPPARSLALSIGKNRHGPTGKVPLVFLPDRGTLREVERR